ncbi:MAG: HNH endonuclease family protein, partial [Chitinophagales bacterium]|nr:HNH endonuclease family protein [Chitinophagales bacterium]
MRTPVYGEMINVVTNKEVNFEEHKFEENTLRTAINNFEFKNGRPITRSMLTWWAFNDNNQEIPALNINFDIEHIFARKRQENDKTLNNTKNLESLGNKVLLEDKINIRAADYRFSDKVKYYKGFRNDKGQQKDGTIITELV